MSVQSYRIYTVSNGKVAPGAEVEDLALKGAGTFIPAVIIGEEGRGRQRGVIPVDAPPMVSCPDQGKQMWQSQTTCTRCGVALGEVIDSHRRHPEEGLVRGRLMYAAMGQTKAGKPKLWAMPVPTTEDHVIVVFRTKPGFRGGSAHTGDRSGWRCSSYGCDASGDGYAPSACPKCGDAPTAWGGGPELRFSPFPGEKLAEGRVAQGQAGAMGGGPQVMALMPKEVVFRSAYSGRLYGGPSSHYYKWDGQNLLAMTWEERSLTDAF